MQRCYQLLLCRFPCIIGDSRITHQRYCQMKQFLEGVIDHIVSLQTGASILQQAVMMQVKVSWELFHDFFLSTDFKAPIATKVVCFSCLLKSFRSLYGKQCGPRSDCSYRSSLFWVPTVCFYAYFVSNVGQSFAADDFSRRQF